MTIEPPAAFGDLLRHARRNAGLTQEALAERAGVSTRAISNLERGINRAPQRDTLEMLLDALDLSQEDRAQWEQARRRLSARSNGNIPDGIQNPMPPGHHLPAPLTTFIGRERETTEVIDLLSQPAVRLLTLTGTGGIGKTRLGINVAKDVRGDFADGVFLVSLAPLAHADLIPMAIAQALGVREGPGQTPLQSISSYLFSRSLLLVLDNFEHVAPGATTIGTLLEQCPGLKVLATSRVPLRLRGEREYPLRSLNDAASAALFIERSRDVRPDFQPCEGQLDTINEICRRLDGLPLAIELAAARSNVLPPRSLLGRLEHPLDILTSGPRDLPERQQTLRNTIAWSYHLLQPEAQALFRSLAVFMGGFTLEAAEAVGEGDVLEALTSLVENNLVEQHEEIGGALRFRMLETIREFGIELLKADDTKTEARERHARYMVDLVTSAPPFIMGPEQVYWLDRLEVEHANVRLALDWFLDHDVEAGLRMLGVLWSFWWLRTPLTVARQYFDRYLERANDSVDPATLALALSGAGIITEWEDTRARGRAIALHEQALSIWLDLPDHIEGRYWSWINLGALALRNEQPQQAEALYHETIEYSRIHHQPIGIIAAQLLLGSLVAAQGHLAQAIDLYREGLALARELGDPFTIAAHTGNLGSILIHEGRFDEARELIAEALALNRQVKLTRHIAVQLENLADIDFRQDRLTSATDLFHESLAEAQRINDLGSIGWAMLGLGKVELRRGHVTAAMDLICNGIISCRSHGDHRGVALSVEVLAAANVQSGSLEQAARLHGWAAAYRERLGIPARELERADLERDYANLRQGLAGSGFGVAWDTGYRLTLEELLDETAGGEAGRLACVWEAHPDRFYSSGSVPV